MRILIVKLGSIGDIVHTLPALSAIRRGLARAEISWVVERRAAEILRDNPLLDRLIEVDTKALRRWPMSGETLLAPRQQLRRLRASSFDIALDFQGLLKSAAISRLARARRSYGFARQALREPASRFLLTKTVEVPPRTHVINKNLRLVSEALGIEVSASAAALEFPIAVGPEHEREAAEAARGAESGYAILNPGGGWPTKLWSAERFGALADQLWAHHGLRSLVTFGPGETELAERVLAASRSGRARAVSLSLKGFYALAKAEEARIYVGGDTGPTHLAVAAGTPVAGLFGPTEWWRNGSPRPDDICIERDDIGCRNDCHRRSCSEWICMDIEVERVLGAVGERLRRARRAGILETTVGA
ncbi:MAG TPA: lipopolysaccharide heptosyltransferase I [Pyrinomonadaceae bacterium]|jgi:lipopolysaccharide heptosyltransferase I|nr:lipopolysaccharide heptosyltransferase I [Pyrinomonadaceae bacterium]